MPCFYSVFCFRILSRLVELTLIHSNQCIVIRFRTHYPKIWYLGKLNNLRSLRKQQSRKLTLTSHSSPPLKVIKPSCKKCPPYTHSKGESFFLKMRRYQMHPNKQVLLSFLQLNYNYLIFFDPPHFLTTIHCHQA